MQCGTSLVRIDSDSTFSLLREAVWLKKHDGQEVTVCIGPTRVADNNMLGEVSIAQQSFG